MPTLLSAVCPRRGAAFQPAALAAPSNAPHQIRATASQRRQAARVAASAVVAATAAAAALPDGSVSIILLAGGVGKRMGAAIPKQYLELKGQPIATYSLETFAKMREVGEIVIVCGPDWRSIFEARFTNLPKHVRCQLDSAFAISFL